MMDAHTWAIRQLVVKIGHRFSGSEVQIPTSRVDRISYEQSTILVSLTRSAVEQSPPAAERIDEGKDLQHAKNN